MMQYKGYVGRVTYDDEDGILYGEVINIDDTITFIGTSVEEIRRAFHEMVDAYIAWCYEEGAEPERPRPVPEQAAS